MQQAAYLQNIYWFSKQVNSDIEHCWSWQI